jgi:glycosyltransferase involved in cell wall biosynthesis
VTPSFNQAAYLETTLRSVLEQNYPLLDYVVMDGGSSDGSLEIIARYSGRLAHWQSGPDGGQASAINEGLRIARGDLLTFINSDDYLLPGTCARVAAYASRHPQIDVFYGDHLRVNERGEILSRVYHAPWVPWIARRTGPYIAQPGTFFRRRIWEKAGGADASLSCCFDTDLWYRFMAAGARFAKIPAPLAAFRLQPASKGLSEAWRQRYRHEQILMRKRYQANLGPFAAAAARIALSALQLLCFNYQRRAFVGIARAAQRRLG